MASLAKGDFLGSGWAFPIAGRSGAIAMVSDDANIAQAILIILQTAPGDRVMLPEFGCGLNRYVFAPGDAATLHLVEAEVKNALGEWEPRIKVIEVTAAMAAQSRMNITVDYLIRAKNSRRNLVYPFYLESRT